ncbi:site-specific DNA-methyltransferase [uncultured Thiodictyon sp.]|uniref:site-specific DNA-methyltransferase n=1 Tax=uncultured Thiodictyon sp. TaxID=1846217 RepID=UPI0025D2B12C|nr:site-specific DNA-methyltransferase [uncultured Thiodictyon sp.]
MSAIDDLIAQVQEPRLREQLRREWAQAQKTRKFGLVFDRHLPELVPIPQARPRRGDLVARTGGTLTDLWRVRRVSEGMAHCVRPEGAPGAGDPWDWPVDELTVVRQFGEPIFPALVPMDQVQNGPAGAPWHCLIEADNFHALQLLTYLYAGKVDCIYIDPPYNTGARDWKYNNDYVDGNDAWRHSKWLSFMEKRLKLAKRLLNPNNSVLIVTIDEKEYLRLGLLLEQIFPGCNVQMTSIVINPKGTARYNEFSRVEEYAFFVFIGDIRLQSFGSDMLTERDYSSETHVRWRGLARTGRKGLRSNNPGSWYPIFLNKSDFSLHSIGESIGVDEGEASVPIPEGTIAVWPPIKDGRQYSWSAVPETLRSIREKGGFKTGRIDHQKRSYPFYYLSAGSFEKIKRGEIVVTGRGQSNELIVQYALGLKSTAPRSVWNKTAYDAGSHGTGILQQIIPGGEFPFPKSIYAVRDAIRFFVAGKSDALVVDFFAGSGTTLNAVNLLNAIDGSKRRCILVTNNEVAGSEADALQSRGLRPGDDQWEDRGICRSVTWPRSKFTILGRRDDGTRLPGDYLTGKTVERERPRRVTQIGFVAAGAFDTPAKKKQLAALIDGLPQSLVTDPCPFICSEDHKASVLFDEAAAEDWVAALDGQDHITDLYIVTANKARFEALKGEVQGLLGPILVAEEEKRPLADGFAANLAYFKLEFLDQDRVALKRAFREILPLLWLKAGAIGPRPAFARGESEPVFFAPPGNPFAVLLDEAGLKALLGALSGRSGLRCVFIVTDSADAFKDLSAEAMEVLGQGSPGLEMVQLYRDYLDNFLINTDRLSADGRSAVNQEGTR